MKRAAKETDNDERPAPKSRRLDEQQQQGRARQYSTSSDGSEAYQGDGYVRQVSNTTNGAGAAAISMPDNHRLVASTFAGLQTSTQHPSTNSSTSSTATARVSNTSVRDGGVARQGGASYNDSSVAMTSQQATRAQASSFPAGMINNRLVASASGQDTTYPLTTSSLPSTVAAIPAASNTALATGVAAHANERPQQTAASLPTSMMNPFLITNVPQPPFGFIPDLASSPTLDRQELQRQQMLAQLAAAQTIAEAQRIGGSLADPRLLSALATSPPLPSNIPILGSLASSSSILDPAAIAQAGAILQAQQQQQQLLLQQRLLAAASLASNIIQPQVPVVTTVSRRYLTTQSGDIDMSLPPAPPVGPVLRPVRTCPLSMPNDVDILSNHQVLLRQQIEFFEARPEDIRHFCPGRRREISVGQVGIRCKHCAASLQPHQRTKGTVYFPSSLRALYQAAQNMGTTHFLEHCPIVPNTIKEQLRIYTEGPANSGYGGKKYWANGALSRGIYETDQGLRFHDNVT